MRGAWRGPASHLRGAGGGGRGWSPRQLVPRAGGRHCFCSSLSGGRRSFPRGLEEDLDDLFANGSPLNIKYNYQDMSHFGPLAPSASTASRTVLGRRRSFRTTVAMPSSVRRAWACASTSLCARSRALGLLAAVPRGVNTFGVFVYEPFEVREALACGRVWRPREPNTNLPRGRWRPKASICTRQLLLF